MKCYAELPCDNIDLISNQIYQYIKNNTEIMSTTKYGWHFVDLHRLLDAAPDLLDFFKTNKLIPRHAAITIVTESDHLPMHTDEPPVIAKINFPVRNTAGWANRWFDNGTMIAELTDMRQPIVFNSQIAHSVDKTTATELPRLVASFTFYNEPLEWLK
jgi:hypothetical protein